MRSGVLLAGVVLALVLTSPAFAQPEAVAAPANPPAPNQPFGFDVAGLMTQTNTAVNTLALNVLASKRLEQLAGEGLIVAPFTVIPEGGDMGMITFVIPWVQEKMTSPCCGTMRRRALKWWTASRSTR